MTSTDFPRWLTEALATVDRPRRLPESNPVVAPGEVRVLTPGRTGKGENRVVLVLSVDDRRKTATVALASTEAEYACDWDYLITRKESGLGYDLMIETDIVSSVWLDQLQTRLGSVPGELFDAILSWSPERSDSWTDDTGRHGPPIRGRSDPRWGYREQELGELNSLSQDCLTRLLQGATFDPALLTMLADLHEDHREEMLVALLAAAEDEGVSIHETSLDVLVQRMADLDPDVFGALEPLLNLASSRVFHGIFDQLPAISWPQGGTNPMADTINEARNRIVAAESLRGREVIHLVGEAAVWRDFEAMHFSIGETRALTLVSERLYVR